MKIKPKQKKKICSKKKKKKKEKKTKNFSYFFCLQTIQMKEVH